MSFFPFILCSVVPPTSPDNNQLLVWRSKKPPGVASEQIDSYEYSFAPDIRKLTKKGKTFALFERVDISDPDDDEVFELGDRWYLVTDLTWFLFEKPRSEDYVRQIVGRVAHNRAR